nr:sulfotransferase [Geotalea sp. SG265]
MTPQLNGTPFFKPGYIKMSRLLTGINSVNHFFQKKGYEFVKLESHALMEKSIRRTGLDDFGGENFLHPLGVLLRSFESDADLNLFGRISVYSELIRMLSNRLLMVADRKRYPAIDDERIVRPLFITGLPRSGTTFLHALLAQDPKCRAPQVWEVMHPSPPPETVSYASDPRITKTGKELKWLDILIPYFKRVHLIHECYPQECIAITSHAFMSYVFESMYHVSSYRIWHDKQDKRPVYDFHRWFLQHLQWRAPGTHWVLKAPSHLMALESLLDVYPDADIVVTHRDPLKVLPSCASFTRVLREPFTNGLDNGKIGIEVSSRWEGSAWHSLQFRQSRPHLQKHFYDVNFTDLERDPMSVVKGIYRHFGRDLENSAELAMKTFIAGNPKDKNGAHHYSLEEFGLDRETEKRRFQFYMDHFSIPPEM